MKILVNRCYGGFGLSKEAVLWLRKRNYAPAMKATLKGEVYEDGSVCDDDYPLRLDEKERADLLPIECVEALKDRASARLADIKVVEIPDGVAWQIEEYDGREWVSEVHRTW